MNNIALDKKGNRVNKFLRKHMLLVLNRTASRGASNEYPQHMIGERVTNGLGYMVKKYTFHK